MDTPEIKVVIHPLRKSDLGAVASLAGKLITIEELASFHLEDPDTVCFMAEAEGKVVGFNLARELYVGIPLSKICIIQGIVVHEDYRRHGIGEKLIETVFNHCVNSKIEAVRTLIDESDIRLRWFVEHLGFQRSSVANFDKNIESIQ